MHHNRYCERRAMHHNMLVITCLFVCYCATHTFPIKFHNTRMPEATSTKEHCTTHPLFIRLQLVVTQLLCPLHVGCVGLHPSGQSVACNSSWSVVCNVGRSVVYRLVSVSIGGRRSVVVDCWRVGFRFARINNCDKMKIIMMKRKHAKCNSQHAYLYKMQQSNVHKLKSTRPCRLVHESNAGPSLRV